MSAESSVMHEDVESLRAALEQLRMVTDRMAAAVTYCSRDLRYLWVSPEYAAWIARPAAEIVGQRIVEVLGPQAYDDLEPYFERVLQGERVEYEERCLVRGLGLRWIKAIYVPTYDARGTPDGWIAVVTDITRRKELEEMLRESDRRKDDFLAMLAHELRGPLAPIRNAVAIMRVLGLEDPKFVYARDIIERQVSHMARLVDDLLDVSRISRGKIALQRETLELADLVQEAVEATRPVIQTPGHTLSVTLPAEQLRIEADRVRIVQVIVNLLTNAAKFTPPGGRIGIEVSRSEAGEAVIRVTDTGVGIEEAMQPRVFEAFVQETSDLARSQGGLGVGLWLAKQLVDLHGGRIDVESAGRGRGAAFTVTLPALPRNARETQPAGLREPTAGSPLRILVVEDNLDTAESLKMLLELHGHEVWMEHDGLAALHAFSRLCPDIAFVDLGLPLLDGFEVARRARRDQGTAGCLLVALSGYGRDEDKAEARRAGFDLHLTKPADTEAIAELLAKRCAARGGGAT
ncbi:two-component hybrid sensor and regulator [Sorangium cellulosum So ce56]|uniref:histidine kinase n=1 Tax=Sorangium cellulosum (strain So ce56) TaxID=448385 RepID=A9GI62_SORC5|nr:ATP-binding protein [Sorangium cellulosum]CAN93222.1 two-component hybrid sensor and regulator [Sorangium cellulosum So ce56]